VVLNLGGSAGAMRFKQLTLLLAATSFLLIGSQTLLGTETGIAKLVSLKWVFPFLGYLITLIFWVMEKSAGAFYWHFRSLATKVEKNFNYKPFTEIKPQWFRFINATAFVYILHGSLMILWIIFLFSLSYKILSYILFFVFSVAVIYFISYYIKIGKLYNKIEIQNDC
jgi:hypothetical protein